jgi:hypothetical protein
MSKQPPKHVPVKVATREEWLNLAGGHLARLIVEAGYEMPATGIRYSVGWPSKGGLGKAKRVIGQCWDKGCSGDKTFEIFVSPVEGKAVAVLGTQLHEMIHAVVGLKEGHKGAFKQLAVKLGFEGPMTETPVGSDLKLKLAAIADKLGAYPHAKLEGRANSGPPKQGTRLIKCECGSCGYVARTTRKWLDDVGAPICPCNAKPMQEDGADDDESDDE